MQKTIDDIYQDMLQVFSQQSGYLPHAACDLAARLYAAAAQVEALYAQAQWVMDQSFPQTAQGLYLDYHAETRGITRSAAEKAAGVLRFSIDLAVGQDLEIPEGTVCMTAAGIRFETTAAGVISAGSLSVDVEAQAVEAGSDGNVAPETVVLMAVPPAGVRRCTNPEAFAGGTDAESDEQLRKRVLDSYWRLPNGANAAYYEQSAMEHPGVAAATAVGRARGIGTVDVYVATAAGTPDEELLAAIEEDLQKKREIAVDLQVLAPKTTQVNVTVAIRPGTSFTFDQVKLEAEQALRGYFTGALLGKEVTLAALGNLLYSLGTVANYRFTAPTQDVAAQVGTLPVLGTLTIQELEEG